LTDTASETIVIPDGNLCLQVKSGATIIRREFAGDDVNWTDAL